MFQLDKKIEYSLVPTIASLTSKQIYGQNELKTQVIQRPDPVVR